LLLRRVNAHRTFQVIGNVLLTPRIQAGTLAEYAAGRSSSGSAADPRLVLG